MVHLSEKMPSIIESEEDAKSSNYLSSNKMIYIELDLNSNGYIWNQFSDESKELALNINDPISSDSQSFQNGTSSMNVSELRSCVQQDNFLDQKLQESNSLVYKNSNLDNEISTLKSYPMKHIFPNKQCQITTSLSLQNNIKAPITDFCVTDNRHKQCSQPKTEFLADETDEKSVNLNISNENVVGMKEHLSDKYETDTEVNSNKNGEKQNISHISILSSRKNNNCFLSKEMIDIPCLQSPLSGNSTDSDIDDLEQLMNTLNIREGNKNVKDKPWKPLVEDFNEIKLDNYERDEDDDYNVAKDNDFSDKCSLSQPLWNSRGPDHQQPSEITKNNKNIQTSCKRPLDDGCSCNDSKNLKNGNSIKSTENGMSNGDGGLLQITSVNGKEKIKREKISIHETSNTSENYNTHHSYVTENLETLKYVSEVLGIKFPPDDCTVSSTEVCSAFTSSQFNGCQQPLASKSSVVVSSKSCNNNIASYIPNFYCSQIPSVCFQTIAIKPTYQQNTAFQNRKIIQQKIDAMTKEDFSKIGENVTCCLHEAAENNDSYFLEVFLKKLDKLQIKEHVINLTNNYRQTALHLAVMKNFSCIVHILIKHGADVNILAKSNREDNSKLEAPLHLAASRLNRMLVKELLKAKNINLDLKNSDGQTALHCAIQARHSAGTDKTFIISKLIKTNANPSCKDKEQGKNILMYAIEFDDYDVISFILKTVSWEYIKKMMTDKSDKGETCLTLVNALDKDHELYSKRMKLVKTLQEYREKIVRELQDAQPQGSSTSTNEKQDLQT